MTAAFAPLGFGLDLTAVHARFDQLEARMTAVDNVLTNADAKLTTLVTGMADFSSDLAAFIATFGDLTPEQQVQADAIDAKLGALIGALSAADSAVGDADGSEVPPVEEPEEPAEPETPAEPTEPVDDDPDANPIP
jgi:uncharacterized coiled-coil protein SlyX